jgi:hypothetical protein
MIQTIKQMTNKVPSKPYPNMVSPSSIRPLLLKGYLPLWAVLTTRSVPLRTRFAACFLAPEIRTLRSYFVSPRVRPDWIDSHHFTRNRWVSQIGKKPDFVSIETDKRTGRPLNLICRRAHCARSTGSFMWRRNCPVCRQPKEKKNPADTVSCSCGKFVWRASALSSEASGQIGKVQQMLKDRTETEYHLTQQGWVKGSSWVCGTKIEDVAAPSVRVESWVEEIDSPSGVALPNVSWRRIWESDSITHHARTELRQRFPLPEYRPLQKA